MKILLSAYACEPNRGSEPGVGWNWAREMAALGHEVWVLTRANNRAVIEEALGGPGAANLHFLYFDLPGWALWLKKRPGGVQFYYTVWQWGAYRLAKEAHARQRFDVVQHLTFGVFRHPSFMGRLGIPFVFGPVGGGETVPWRLRRRFPWRGWLADGVRDLVGALTRLDPFLREAYAASHLILAKTPETQAMIPDRHRGRSQCMLEIGIAPEKIVDGLPPGATDGVLRLLYVGRFLYLKGVHLGIQAMGQLVARGIQVELTMVGKGPEEAAWRSEAERRGVADRIRWVPWVRHDELPAVYAAHDILLFPSLRDSSGNVVLEALACGCPVVCVDLGGPPEILAGQPCGTVVGVQGRDEDQLAAALADALGELATDRKRLADMRVAALARAREMTWRAVVARLWGNDSPFLAGISRPPEQRPDVSGGTGGDIATR